MEAILRKCDQELQKPLKDRSAAWSSDEAFFSTATVNLRAIKEAWRQEGVQPFLAQIENRAQMTWAYQRLALLGLPVEFIYTGSLSPLKKILRLHPHGLVDIGGWGYLASLSYHKHRGKEWFPLVGNVRLMPDSVVSFLADAEALLTTAHFASQASRIL
jgi:hypothetical protein